MKHWMLGVVALATMSVGCSKGKLEATVKGYQPGSATTVMIHVKGDKGATVECQSSGLGCSSIDLGASGEGDLSVDTSFAGDEAKVVFLRAKYGRREAFTTVKLDATSGLAASLKVDGALLNCISRTCSGYVTLLPMPTLYVKAAAGTTVDIGADHSKVDATGSSLMPFHAVTTPPFASLRASQVCNPANTSPIGTGKITLGFADGGKVSSDVVYTMSMVSSSLGMWGSSEIAKGPLVFPWEKAPAPNRSKHAAMFLTASGCEGFAGAPDSVLGDVSVVAISRSTSRVDTCTYALSEEKSGRGRGSASGKLTMNDVVATAYDRATGRKLAERTFLAPKACDPNITLTSAASSIKDQVTYASTGPIVAWAATFAR